MRFKRSLSTTSMNTASLHLSYHDENAVFIDTATKKETKVVPESRALSVSAYLEVGYTYEPVIITISNDDTSSGSSGAGCNNSALFGIFLLPLALIFTSFSKGKKT